MPDFTITLTTDQVDAINRARAAFNTRTGQSINSTLYAKGVLRAGVVNELSQQRETAAKFTTDVAQATYSGVVSTENAAIQATKTTEEALWS